MLICSFGQVKFSMDKYIMPFYLPLDFTISTPLSINSENLKIYAWNQVKFKMWKPEILQKPEKLACNTHTQRFPHVTMGWSEVSDCGIS